MGLSNFGQSFPSKELAACKQESVSLYSHKKKKKCSEVFVGREGECSERNRKVMKYRQCISPVVGLVEQTAEEGQW